MTAHTRGERIQARPTSRVAMVPNQSLSQVTNPRHGAQDARSTGAESLKTISHARIIHDFIEAGNRRLFAPRAVIGMRRAEGPLRPGRAGDRWV